MKVTEVTCITNANTSSSSSLCLATVDDSSGKYTKGFFWGNNYWTGSMDQCSYIYQNDSDTDPAPKKKGRNTDITYINGNFLGSSEMEHQNPPFVPGFYMAKILINGTESFNAVSVFFSVKMRSSTDRVADVSFAICRFVPSWWDFVCRVVAALPM